MAWRIFKKDKQGYQYTKKNGKKERIHRLAAIKKYGDIPKGFIIHHIDENKDNNKHDNLIMLHPKDHYRLHVKKNLIIGNK